MLSLNTGVTIIGSICVWFANRFVLEYILQARIDANKVTQFLPLELTVASIAVTAFLYVVFYPVFVYLNDWSFEFARFLPGLFVSCGLSLLIVIVYAGSQIWISWWSDGEFLFRPQGLKHPERDTQEVISIKNSKGSSLQNLAQVAYVISESKVVFLVDIAGNKRTTQYNLGELEKLVGGRYFRLNRKILVNRKVISQVKKLPNHRLLVTIGPAEEGHHETVSRYKSTRFRQWFERGSVEE